MVIRAEGHQPDILVSGAGRPKKRSVVGASEGFDLDEYPRCDVVPAAAVKVCLNWPKE